MGVPAVIATREKLGFAGWEDKSVDPQRMGFSLSTI
jgi:hypothetical protein